MNKITIIGSGAWGTALGQTLADNKNEVIIWGIEKSQIDDINNNHKNSQFFPNVELNNTLKATLDLKAALTNTKIVVIAIPSPFIKQVIKQVIENLDHKVYFVNVAKGFEKTSQQLMIPFLESIIPSDKKEAIISLLGPTHAEELALRNFTAITSVSSDLKAATLIQNTFNNDYFRVYVQSDIIGAELGAALKNPIAIVSGILNGYGYGINSIAALLTRGLAEMKRIGIAFGAKSETFNGLTGIGDLIVTGTSNLSRNFNFGTKIGQAQDASKILSQNSKTVEGVFACKIIKDKIAAKGLKIKTPIINALYNILYNNKPIMSEMKRLTNRGLLHE